MKKLTSLILVLAMALALAACGGNSGGNSGGSGNTANSGNSSNSGSAGTSGGDTSALTIAYVPTTMNNPFWTAMMGGIREEMTAQGLDPDSQLVTVDAESDQATMNNYIYDLINQNVDVVIMAPMDCTACTEALQACAEDMMSKLAEGSKIYVMNQPSGSACVQREQGFLDTVGGYFNIIGTSDTVGDTATTLPVAEDAITSDAELAGFFCINDMAALGCVQACAAANRDDILIYGVDGNPDFMGYVGDGSATASAAQQPSVIGATAVKTALDYLAGTDVESEVVIPVELITTDNISQFDVSDWQ